MSIIKELKNSVKEIIKQVGYDVDDVILVSSSRPDLGDYQINDAMRLAKMYHTSPIEIANKIADELKKDARFTNINIAGPGFINLTLSPYFLYASLNKILVDFSSNVDKEDKKTIFMDYGGANIAKTLHVGHLRSANIGEAVKRLARYLGLEVISDVHFGDIGRQSGMVISEIKRRYPNLDFFNENFKGNYNDIEVSITEEELGEIYPTASTAAKEDEERMAEVVQITKELEEETKKVEEEKAAKEAEEKKKAEEDIKGLKVGKYTLKYGTYKGSGKNYNSGENYTCTFILNSDGTCTYTRITGETTEKYSGKYEVTRDSWYGIEYTGESAAFDGIKTKWSNGNGELFAVGNDTISDMEMTMKYVGN